jgi:hypothetical protein
MTRFSPTSAPRSRRDDLQLIAESIPHIVWMADPDGSTGYLNRWGIEFVRDETLTLLGESGVDYAQGYHLGRPAPLTHEEAA